MDGKMAIFRQGRRFTRLQDLLSHRRGLLLPLNAQPGLPGRSRYVPPALVVVRRRAAVSRRAGSSCAAE
jgi:hypothetical protein